MKAFRITLEARREYRTQHLQPMAFPGPLGRVLFGNTRGTSCRPGLRDGVVSPNHTPPTHGLQSNLPIRLEQLPPGWREVAERVPRPPGLAARKPRPHARSPRTGRARLVRPWTLLPAACAAGDCLLLVGNSTLHIPVSREMQGRKKRRDEVVNWGYSLCAREGRLSGCLGLGRGEITVCRCFARPPVFFSMPEMRRVGGGVYLRSVCVYRCARAGIFSKGIRLCPPTPEPRVCGGQSVRKPKQVLELRACGGRSVSPVAQAGGLCGPGSGRWINERFPASACQRAVLPPRLI